MIRALVNISIAVRMFVALLILDRVVIARLAITIFFIICMLITIIRRIRVITITHMPRGHILFIMLIHIAICIIRTPIAILAVLILVITIIRDSRIMIVRLIARIS